ncbi:uncharacterized protein AB675_10795 [Cyphellophora attinorum]|uniref:Uncharacterized protein n=1 Tax=Cyphellophora attinorum TaxID=1664694 RepID=A0A0N0NMN4_9EURO|nr:uncharacterized protein AB675_10795 [Phialophora attinorum]KPI40661.1 hypothetical protein AB675_10795 [Phialophora attinorum]
MLRSSLISFVTICATDIPSTSGSMLHAIAPVTTSIGLTSVLAPGAIGVTRISANANIPNNFRLRVRNNGKHCVISEALREPTLKPIIGRSTVANAFNARGLRPFKCVSSDDNGCGCSAEFATRYELNRHCKAFLQRSRTPDQDPVVEAQVPPDQPVKDVLNDDALWRILASTIERHLSWAPSVTKPLPSPELSSLVDLSLASMRRPDYCTDEISLMADDNADTELYIRLSNHFRRRRSGTCGELIQAMAADQKLLVLWHGKDLMYKMRAFDPATQTTLGSDGEPGTVRKELSEAWFAASYCRSIRSGHTHSTRESAVSTNTLQLTASTRTSAATSRGVIAAPAYAPSGTSEGPLNTFKPRRNDLYSAFLSSVHTVDKNATAHARLVPYMQDSYRGEGI